MDEEPEQYTDNSKKGVYGILAGFTALILLALALWRPFFPAPTPSSSTPVPCVTCVSRTATPARTPGKGTTPTPTLRPVSTVPVPVLTANPTHPAPVPTK